MLLAGAGSQLAAGRALTGGLKGIEGDSAAARKAVSCCDVLSVVLPLSPLTLSPGLAALTSRTKPDSVSAPPASCAGLLWTGATAAPSDAVRLAAAGTPLIALLTDPRGALWAAKGTGAPATNPGCAAPRWLAATSTSTSAGSGKGAAVTLSCCAVLPSPGATALLLASGSGGPCVPVSVCTDGVTVSEEAVRCRCRRL